MPYHSLKTPCPSSGYNDELIKIDGLDEWDAF